MQPRVQRLVRAKTLASSASQGFEEPPVAMLGFVLCRDLNSDRGTSRVATRYRVGQIPPAFGRGIETAPPPCKR